jgi:hypothetical protein
MEGLSVWEWNTERKLLYWKSERHVRLVKKIFANSVSLYGGCEETWIEGLPSEVF